MPLKRRPAVVTRSSSNQSTLAFHGSTNRVTKAGAKAQNTKKNLLEKTVDKIGSPDVTTISPTDETEPDTAEAVLGVQAEKVVAKQQASSTPEEVKARGISEKQLKSYWTTNEKARTRVHQKDLTLHEKILRDFDMSTQYGPCTGIPRSKRWKRAHRLKLNPPIEVLAVLLKEQDSDGKKSAELSRVDELLNTRNVELETGG